MAEQRDHGGGIDAAARAQGIPADRWLDLSTGINPRPYPLPALAPRTWARLPDREMMAGLRAAAARYYGAPDPACVVPAPGSQAVIQWLPRLAPPGARVAVVGPTYNEHAAAWRAAGHRVAEVDAPPAPGDGFAVVVAVNPNNPDGRRWPGGALRDLAQAGTRVVVDEAFADVVPDATLAGDVAGADLVVLRSFGKFFGLAGLRLGFAIAAPPLATDLAAALGPWAVSGPAAKVAAAALTDGAWIAETRARLAGDAARLRALLTGAGLAVVGGTDLFVLAAHDRAPDLAARLAGAAILVRTFPARPAWLRFGLPGTDGDFSRLAKVLSSEP
ncbi:MAG: threonine-phosphate decarboxylase [Hyphomicrobiales bacterium]|nr:threonine-phosphate decarboxylase [Hyphomicrobiales bacterium]MCP5374014.1 threonine-phosphate decarboxylase [Hyphomicrobiales bacterium]